MALYFYHTARSHPVATREQGACNRFRATVCIPPRIDQESNPCPLLMNGAIWTSGPYSALSA
eukprot:scaffold30052_cov140-Isochrysis_galbana.AAC.1